MITEPILELLQTATLSNVSLALLLIESQKIPIDIDALEQLAYLHHTEDQYSYFRSREENIRRLFDTENLDLKLPANMIGHRAIMPRKVSIPSTIALLHHLKSVEIELFELKQLPATLWTLKNLEELIIYKTRIITIWDELVALQQLRFLEIRDNPYLEHIPSNIGFLPHLEMLDLSNNALTRLPKSIYLLQSLKGLDLRGNPWHNRTKIKAELREALPNCTIML